MFPLAGLKNTELFFRIINTVGEPCVAALVSNKAAEAFSTAVTSVSETLSFAAAPGLTIMGMGLMLRGAKQILTPQNNPIQRGRLRYRQEGNKMVAYRDTPSQISILKRVQSLTKKYIPAAINLVLGWNIASGQMSAFTQTLLAATGYAKHD